MATTTIRRTNWKSQAGTSWGHPSTVTRIAAISFLCCLLLFYGHFAGRLLLGGNTAAAGLPQAYVVASSSSPEHIKKDSTVVSVDKAFYPQWKQITMDLARLSPSEALRRLKTDDPFGVRLISPTDDLHSNNTVRSLLNCRKNRISIPDQRNHTAARRFRQGQGMIYFQHLRKAGGTHFCTLATANFQRHQIPPYYCMPDYSWPPPNRPRQKCAGCLHGYTAQQIMERIGPHRIAGNEWDSFDTIEHWKIVDAVYVTSFRSPMDRAVSQFRFECAESRGCKETNITEWWKKRRDLYNVYTRTFSDVQRQGRLVYGDEFAKQRADALGKALDTVTRFHLVLHMEYLSYAAPMVQAMLGFADLTALTKRVRPHNNGLQRKDSWDAKTYLTKEQFEWMQPTLALDEILTDAARRLFLERLVCGGDEQ